MPVPRRYEALVALVALVFALEQETGPLCAAWSCLDGTSDYLGVVSGGLVRWFAGSRVLEAGSLGIDLADPYGSFARYHEQTGNKSPIGDWKCWPGQRESGLRSGALYGSMARSMALWGQWWVAVRVAECPNTLTRDDGVALYQAGQQSRVHCLIIINDHQSPIPFDFALDTSAATNL